MADPPGDTSSGFSAADRAAFARGLVKTAPKLPHRPLKDRTLRKRALTILALKLDGKTTAEIGEVMHLKPATVNLYLRDAGKRKLITSQQLLDARDRIDYVMVTKALNRIETALDSPDADRAEARSLQVAKETIFKSYDQQNAPAQSPTNVLAIKIETCGPVTALREGSGGGTPRFLE